MKRFSVLLVLCLLSIPLATPAKTRRSGAASPDVTLAGVTIYGLTTTDHLVTFDATAPQVLTSNQQITGVLTGDVLLGIDFRPSTEDLYLLSTTHIYVLNVDTAVATPVGTGITTGLNGTAFGVDFNPSVDLLRVVSENQQNLRISPVTGAVSNIDTNLAYATGDAHAGAAPHITGAAYSNNVPGAATTTLYDIDSNFDTLAIQNPPNSGTLTTVGGLGVDTTDLVGFDIRSTTGVAYASLTTSGALFSTLYTINLGTGLATSVGNIGGTSLIRDIAVPIGIKQGADTVGIYDPAQGFFYLRNSNSPGSADIVFGFGAPGSGFVPLAGDWDGDGIDTAGLYDPTTSTFFLRNSNTPGNADLAFSFGTFGVGYVPVTGDWDGNGTDTVGLYNPTTGFFFIKNTNSSGPASSVFSFGGGNLGNVPIAGDWDGNGTDTVGVYNPTTGTFFLKYTNVSGNADAAFSYGPLGSVPVRGDFDNNGTDTVGVYVPSTGAFFLRNSNTPGAADSTFVYGPPNENPLVGDWDGH